jgi:hypothetical protein
LACRWRITPLDEMQLRLKACLFEVEQKEEMLALLHEHLHMENITDLGNHLEVCPEIPDPRMSEGQRKRLQSCRGILNVKVT